MQPRKQFGKFKNNIVILKENYRLHSQRIRPLIHIPIEPYSLSDVFVEEYANFDIFWYHWPMDGFIFYEEDYEPIVLIYGVNDERCYLVTRLRWDYRYFAVHELSSPIEIVFADLQHHPIPRLKVNPRTDRIWLSITRRFTTRVEYEPMQISSEFIPCKFRKGLDHGSKGGGLVEDPIEVANRVHQDFCRNNNMIE